MRKLLFAAAAVTALLVAGALPAWAHEEITPSSFPTGKPTFFTLRAANEKNADLTKVTLTAPSGIDFGEATRAPAGWTASAAPRSITWTGGTVKHAGFDEWGYEIEGANQPGTLTYKVTLGYADGSTEDVNVAVTAVAAGTSPTTAATASATSGAVTTEAATTPTTTAEKSGGGETARQRANIALGLGILAVILSVVGIAMGARKRAANGGGGSGAAPAATGAGDKQDW
jgi:uncharacterized protein YcnI